MTRLRVWAPSAREVVVEGHGHRRTLRPTTTPDGGPDGFWEDTLGALEPGEDYALSVDGGPARPDPRSPWQPAGVHGPSRCVDHGAFPWSDAAFTPVPWREAVVYELHIGTFSAAGTFEGAIEHLDHLVTLGATHVELMPVAAFPGQRGWGYDGVSPFAPHAPYGGPEGLKRLVDACHARGLAVLLDVVFNHLGPSGNYLAEFGPYFTTRHHTPWGWAINFDGEHSDEVRRYVIDVALSWISHYHVDGLRLDAVQTMVDTGALHILEELAAEVHHADEGLGRAVVVIAEGDLNDPRLVREPARGGYDLDAMWSDDFHHALHAALTGERSGYYVDFGPIASLAKALREGFVLDGRHSLYRRRRHGRSAQGVDGSRLVAFTQNHDQVGNRARGERLSHLVGPEGAMVAAAVLLGSAQVPLLFQGEEWAASSPFLYFTDHEEPELASAVREGRRREFAELGYEPTDVPDPQAPETFQRSKLLWTERGQAPHAHVLGFYQALLALRRAAPELQAGPLDSQQVRFDEEARWLTLERGPFLIACALGDRGASIPFGGARASLLLDSSLRARLLPTSLELPGRTAAVLRLERASSLSPPEGR